MKNKKLVLKGLEIKSFVTEMDMEKVKTVKGGDGNWGGSLRCSRTCTNGAILACPCPIAV